MLKKREIIIFAIIFIIIFVYAVQNLIFPDWDFFNYRFYNVWAFLHNRITKDYLVSNLRTCFNPMIDIPTYISLFALNKHPYWFIGLSLLDSTLAVFLIYKIANKIFEIKSKIYLFIIYLFCIAYIIFSPIMVLLFGFDQNDIQIAMLFLLSVLILLHSIFLPYSKKRNQLVCLAGGIMGLTIGFKLTACGYFISLIITFAILSKFIEKPLKTITIFCISAFISFLLIDGIWICQCWRYYHNPFFPYFNNIFRSEYAQPTSILTQDFEHLKAQNLYEFLFFPFFKSNIETKRLFGVDNYAWDPRYAINLIATVFLIPISLFLFRKSKNGNGLFLDLIKYNNLFFILTLSITAYYVNLFIFGTYRYISAINIMYGIILAILLHCIVFITKKYKVIPFLIFATGICYFVYTTQKYGYIEYVQNYNYDDENIDWHLTKVIDSFKDLYFEDNSYVIAATSGTSFAFVRRNPNVKYIGSTMKREYFDKNKQDILKHDIYFMAKYIDSEYTEKKIADIVASDKKIYVIYNDDQPISNYFLDSVLNFNTEDKREYKDCDYKTMKIFNTQFWATGVIQCTFFNREN